MKIIRYLATLLVCILVWQALALALGSTILPPPLAVFVDFYYQIQDKSFWVHTGYSALRVGSGLAVGLVVAFPLGLLLGMSRSLDNWMGPLIYLTYPIPKVLFLPVLLVLFGLGEFPKILLVALTVGYQILVVTRDQVCSLDRRYFDSFITILPSHWGQTRRTLSLIRHVVLPAALPSAVTSLRLASGTAVAVLFISESFATQHGLGYLIMDAWGGLNLPRMFTGILTMSLLGLVLYEGSNWLEFRLSRWRRG